MIDCVVYDLDGTLIDSASLIHSILNRRRAQLKLTPIERHDLIPWLSLGGNDLIAAALQLSSNQLEVELHNFREQYAAIPTPLDTVYPGLHDVLYQLKRAGVRLAICTNKPRNLAYKVLYETQLLDFFAFMCAGGDLGMKKPHPDTLQACIDFLCVSPSRTLYVGDSLIDQQLSHLVGVPFVQFLPGYDDGVDTRQVYYKMSNHQELLFLV